MKHIFLVMLCAVVSVSCNNSESIQDAEPDSAKDDQPSSEHWFPTIKLSPSVIPALPNEYVSSFVSNKYFTHGKRTLVWGRSEDINNLNSGGTVTGPLFTISEEYEDGWGDELYGSPMTPERRLELRKNYVAFGYTDMHFGSRQLGAWTFDWFSGELGVDTSFVAWLYKPGVSGVVSIGLTGDSVGNPIWNRFTAETKETAEHLLSPDSQETKE